MQVSKLLALMPESPIRKLVPFALQAKKSGVKVFHLNIGDPDIKTPKVMIDALKNWTLDPIAYANSHGQPNLLKALVWYYQKLGFKIDESNLQITSGGSEAILWALMAICDRNDEVIVFEPFYANYNGFSIMSRVKLVPVKTNVEVGFHLPDIKEIEKKISKATKAILLTNPNNPTGTVYTKKELEMLVKLAKKHKLYLLSDETYREFCYDQKSAISLFSYQKEIPNQILILDSLSKRYSLCGARLGCILTDNKELLAGFLRFSQARLCSGLIDQEIAAKLTEVPINYFKENIKEYEARRNIVVNGLRKITGVTSFKPEGAFYLIAKLAIKNSENFAKWLLTDFRNNNETIMVAPASGFYKTKNLGKDEIRIAYVINQKDLLRSMELLKIALEQYKKFDK